MKAYAVLLLATAALAQPPIMTKCGDNARSCSFQDTTLTPAAVAQHGMQMLPPIPVVGDARGMDAQPLIWGGVMVLASEANVIRGVQPIGGAAIWQTPQLCVPVKSVPENDMWGTQDHFGMMSTGIIDPDTAKLYQVATCSKDGSGSQASIQQRMFVLNVRSGAVLASTVLDAISNGTRFSDSPRKQRGALALWKQNGVKFVLIEAGSFNENDPNAGWFLGYDTFDNQVKASLPTHCGPWQTGLGPVIDDATSLIYVGCGNGPFDHVSSFGESAMQIQFVPPIFMRGASYAIEGYSSPRGVTIPASFAVLHSWAPFSDSGRTCTNPQLSASPKAVGKRLTGAAMRMPNMLCDGSWSDSDNWLTGTLLPKFHLYLGCGKDGVCSAIDTQHFPDTQPSDFSDTKKNCAKVRMYDLGWDVGDPCPARSVDLNRFAGGKTRHIHSPIVHFEQNGVTYLTVFAENSALQVWAVNPDGTFRYIARGKEMASDRATGPQGGMAGGWGAVSSNNGANAIGWFSVPYTDVNRTVGQGRMIAYDLSNIGALEGTGKFIPTIWTSADYTISKFGAPIVWSGTVIIPDYAGSVLEWRLN